MTVKLYIDNVANRARRLAKLAISSREFRITPGFCRIHHVMPRGKKRDAELWTAVSGLLALISRAYHNFSLWHHEFIKAKLSAALVVLN